MRSQLCFAIDTVAGMMITAEQRELYRTEGYMILPGVIPPDMLNMLREECSYYLGYYDSIMDAKGVKTENISHRGKRYFINNRYRLSNRLYQFIFSDLMAEVVRATVGDEAYLFHEQWVVKGAEQGMKFAWHQDSGYVKWYNPTTLHRPYVTCWCTLDDVSEENGTVYLLPHSRGGTKGEIINHIKEDGTNDLIGYTGSDPGDPVIVPAGSIVAFDSFDQSSMVRALGLAFPEDRATYEIGDQYLFGTSLMVCPVTTPMLYGPYSQPVETNEYSRTVYLPASALWYDARTGTAHEGGQTIKAHAPLKSIPWFLQAGAILPKTCVMQYVDEMPGAPYELHVYTGSDGEFVLYEDSGDSYEYESGAFSRIRICWNQNRQELTLSPREGIFPGLIAEREYSVVFYTPSRRQIFTFCYTGAEHRIRLTDGKEPVLLR